MTGADCNGNEVDAGFTNVGEPTDGADIALGNCTLGAAFGGDIIG